MEYLKIVFKQSKRRYRGRKRNNNNNKKLRGMNKKTNNKMVDFNKLQLRVRICQNG